jgi:D-serine deaminase-like pyridoxal phosphate-dependent protein
MEPELSAYAIKDAGRIVTPALLIYPEQVDANIRAAVKMADNDPNRWRPHIKTAKLGYTLRRLLEHGVQNFKSSTTLELLAACQLKAADVLVAFAMMGANRERVIEIAEQYPKTRVSVLVESAEQAASWHNTQIGIFIDVNSGMNRTGVDQDRVADLVALGRKIGGGFRGLHYYDGHMSGVPVAERKSAAFAGYDRLLKVVEAFAAAGVAVEEVITSGTPAAPFGVAYPGFRNAGFVHRISPGTVVYNDMVSLQQLPDYGFAPAALVLSTVISHPLDRQVTCDGGHKSVSADAGVPTCSVLGHPELTPLKPSEEHLPIQSVSDAVPELGSKLYLLPRHVCPTVNNFDHALMVVNGEIRGIESVTARGHENPLVLRESVAV